MDEYPESSSKRARTTNGYSASPNGYRSQSPEFGTTSPTYNLAERPAPSSRRTERPDLYDNNTPDDQSRSSYYDAHESEPPISKSPSPTPLPKAVKPTTLNYRLRTILHGHKKGISMVKFSPDGQMIASASADGTVRIWNSQTGKHQQTLEGHLAGISAISWSPDSKLIASGSDDKTIRLWIVATGKQHPKILSGHHNSVFSLAFSPTGSMLVSGSFDEAVFLWDVRTPRMMRSLPAHSDPVSGVDFCLDGTLIASCAGDGLIRIWDTPSGQCLRTLVHEDRQPVTGVRFTPNGKFVLAWTLDGCVRLWNYGEGRCVKTYQGHKNEKYSLGGCFGIFYAQEIEEGQLRNGAFDTKVEGGLATSEMEAFAFIASGSEDGALVIWDVQSKDTLQRVADAHSGPTMSVDAHPAKVLLVSGGADSMVKVWEIASTSEVGGAPGEPVATGVRVVESLDTQRLPGGIEEGDDATDDFKDATTGDGVVHEDLG
ncbi:MAG: WD domain protein [Bogoriella megaspora]|nr:MAG: WD domain protein [Bogoriella megaspora]